ncbi:hypothetical protein ABTX60_42110 [Streptomyces sp. NPDC126510]|uniref:hypothetical protein n=1 Tax=Streptomyces sp. NPDC126510 TaxID=3155317 RepID=UPI0033321C8F
MQEAPTGSADRSWRTLRSAPDLDSVMLGRQTVFYGTVIDEAQLFGQLARFRMLGLLVTEMRPLPY